MRADKDDVPDYIRPRKKQGPWRALAILGVGSAIFWGLVTVFAKPIVIDVAQLKQAIRFGGEPVFSQHPTQPKQPPSEALQGNDQDWIRSNEAQQTIQANRELEEWSRQRAQETQERQTSFNDSNYKPKPIANTFAASIYQAEAVSQPQKPLRKEVREVTRSGTWSWESGHQKKRVFGEFDWIERNGVIDHSSVCQNYQKGSLIYRDCRKGAKAKFKSMCGSYQPACNPSNNMMP
ncbi:hypothetical protein [Phytopseudomonas seleniipraecipitans]|uniref:Uncharacterized protein n=1 Tax=Phytopseudomonas seleniipraecipitans TaxID=640205 RepID=A0A1G7J6R7_9GAMM|nr:hypothetical protein [Pseudomonas seleniipraecipitans]SDF20558.1 hypothetical protein SAMN05216381_1002 [Pseudomonas seleniipraecipitans]